MSQMFSCLQGYHIAVRTIHMFLSSVEYSFLEFPTLHAHCKDNNLERRKLDAECYIDLVLVVWAFLVFHREINVGNG